MSLAKRIALVLIVAVSIPLESVAQVASERGVGSIQVRRQATAEQKDMALHVARLNALDRYVARLSTQQQLAYQEIKQSNDAQLTQYIISDLIMDEEVNDGYYTVVVKSDINTKLLEQFLMDSAGYSAAVAATASEIVAIMIARSTASVEDFDDTVSRQISRSTTSSAESSAGRSGAESEVVSKGSVATSEQVEAEVQVESSASEETQSSGSVVRRADVTKWRVSEASGIAAQLSGILTDVGLNIIPSEYIPTVDLEGIRTDFGEGDDLKPATKLAMANALKAESIPYVLIGTLDVDLPSIDPVTGNERVYVTVNAELLNLEGRFPRIEAAIGPVQFAGLGPSESVARNNAITTAAQAVGEDLLDRLTNKDVR